MARTRNEALHEQRKAEILAAAAERFAAKGAHQTTIHDICEASGLSAGAIYRYFPNKEAIVVALAEVERAEAAAIIGRIAAPGDFLTGFADVLPELTERLSDTGYARLSLELGAEATRNPLVARALAGIEAEIEDGLRAALEASQRGARVDAELDPGLAAFILVALFDGLSGRVALEGEAGAARLPTALTWAVRRLLEPRGATPETSRRSTE